MRDLTPIELVKNSREKGQSVTEEQLPEFARVRSGSKIGSASKKVESLSIMPDQTDGVRSLTGGLGVGWLLGRWTCPI
jgi:hypothetical protein